MRLLCYAILASPEACFVVSADGYLLGPLFWSRSQINVIAGDAC